MTLVPVATFANGSREEGRLVFRCPMADAGLVARLEINFQDSSVVYSMEGINSSKKYFFSLEGDIISLPGDEFGEEKIDLKRRTLSSRPGYTSTWHTYSCQLAGG